ncbi:hypothetical protein AB5N19_04715 [Seiridium cardinale]
MLRNVNSGPDEASAGLRHHLRRATGKAQEIFDKISHPRQTLYEIGEAVKAEQLANFPDEERRQKLVRTIYDDITEIVRDIHVVERKIEFDGPEFFPQRTLELREINKTASTLERVTNDVLKRTPHEQLKKKLEEQSKRLRVEGLERIHRLRMVVDVKMIKRMRRNAEQEAVENEPYVKFIEDADTTWLSCPKPKT